MVETIGAYGTRPLGEEQVHEEHVDEGQVDKGQGEGEKDASAAAGAGQESRIEQEGPEQGPQQSLQHVQPDNDPSLDAGPHVADHDLKEMAVNFERQNGQQDVSPQGTASISASDFKRMHAASASGVSGKQNPGQVARTPEEQAAHAARNEFFKGRWAAIKKSWESLEIDTDKMEELHKFEELVRHASFETIKNIASLLSFMHGMKNNPLVQITGTLIEEATGGRIKKKTAEKIIRTVPHIIQALALSIDPDTRKMAAGGFRLALTPHPVEGDKEAGERGLESAEVRLIRDAIQRALKAAGFHPYTGELVDKVVIATIAQARERAIEEAAARQKEFYLNGWDALFSEKKEELPVEKKDRPVQNKLGETAVRASRKLKLPPLPSRQRL
jgi:hypothetical protein